MSTRQRRGLRACASLVLLCGATAAQAVDWQLEAGAGAEHVSTSADNWRQQDLALRATLAPRRSLELQAIHATRYGLNDSALAVGLGWALGEGWALGARLQASPEHRFLPQHAVTLDISRELGDGWVLGAGAGDTRYRPEGGAPSSVSTLRLGLERYVGNWRWAAGLSQARLAGGAQATGWRLQLDHYVGEVGRLGLLVASGDELESLPDGLVASRTTAVALVGRWPLAPRWALTGELSTTRQSGFERRPATGAPPPPDSRRTGGRLGVQHDF